MRQAMAEAKVGDEQKGEDPTVNALVERVAELLGMEAAVFLPSGTMCNEISLAVHCRQGDVFYCDSLAHPLRFEAGAPAAIAGAMACALPAKMGVYTPEDLEAAIGLPSRYAPTPRLVWVEQTANIPGGTCWSIEQIRSVSKVARQHSMAMHMDGARLLNAVVAMGCPAACFARYFDTVWIDFSKGLGAPVGAVLAGSEELIDQAWRWKQRLGGSMRQAGVIAAGALWALDHNVERLGEDHENARKLAEGLAEIPGVEIDLGSVQTNIVIASLPGWPGGAHGFIGALLEGYGVRASAPSASQVRFVTHLDISGSDVDAAIDAVRHLCIPA
ncbi:MAG: threonine aldolase family protein [Actinobacteria bacterium]|nr:threonine aldolase family protein [Actinomycetota bacterium]